MVKHTAALLLAFLALSWAEEGGLHTLIDEFGKTHADELNATEFTQMYDALVDEPVDRTEAAGAIFNETDTNGDRMLTLAEVEHAGPDLLNLVFPTTCASQVTIEAYDRKYLCNLSSSHDHEEEEDPHAGRRRGGKKAGKRSFHDSHEGHDHGDTATPMAGFGPSVTLGAPKITIGEETITCVEMNGTYTEVECNADPHAGHADDDEDVDLEPVKGGFIVLLFFAGLAGLVPLAFRNKFKSDPRVKKYLSYGNAFGGGVFLAVAITHIYPEAVKLFEENECYRSIETGVGVRYKSKRMTYPILELLALIGYLLVMFFEKVLFLDFGGLHEEVMTPDPEGATNIPSSISSPGADKANGGGHGHGHGQQKDDMSGIAPYVLLAALGVHSLFAGLAFGVAQEEAELYSLLIAIVSHKSFAALSLGTSFVRNEVIVARALPLLLFFASITPIGVGIGIAISDLNVNTTSAILQAIATGTFLYVGATEVVPDEFGHGGSAFDRWIKYAFFLAGGIIISLIGLNTHEH